MDAFPFQDLANNLKDLDLGSDTPPVQRSLGLNWDLESHSPLKSTLKRNPSHDMVDNQ